MLPKSVGAAISNSVLLITSLKLERSSTSIVVDLDTRTPSVINIHIKDHSEIHRKGTICVCETQKPQHQQSSYNQY